MKILAIETSCDDTGIAILEINGSKNPSFRVLSNVIASQIDVHQKYGGIYPALAKREHQRNLVPSLTEALEQAKLLNLNEENQKVNLENILEREPELQKQLIPFLEKYNKPDVDLIAVTNGPGLEPCLWVGVNFAKSLAKKWRIPIVPVNHIEAHILVNLLDRPMDGSVGPQFPAISLVVSGGHTQIILMEKIGKYKILGETRDDAAGECFDKCAKILGLGYPGGPAIAEFAQRWKSEVRNPKYETNFKLPRPMINTKDYDFSFSGLKTAVLYAWKKLEFEAKPASILSDRSKCESMQINMAAEIQQAIIDVLIKKTLKAVKDYNAKTLILGGGVTANRELRARFEFEIKNLKFEIKLLVPQPKLSTDNGLMVAIAGYFNRKKKILKSDFTKIVANGNLRIGE